MTTLSSSHAEPLRSRADELKRVSDIVGKAIVDGRLWVMFVDGDGRQVPTVVPIDDIPWAPEPRMLDALGMILSNFRNELTTDAGAGSVLFTLERFGKSVIDPNDRVWATALADMCRARGIKLRGVFVSTGGGVRRVT